MPGTFPFARLLELPLADLLALGFFLVAWAGYAYYTDYSKRSQDTLSAVMSHHRLRWMRNLVEQENRVADSTMIGNLMRAVSFFASTSILILGGLLALLGSLDRSYEVILALPFVADDGKLVFEVKVAVLVIIFVYTFFKFTWSIRQFNYCCVAMAGAPATTAPKEEKEHFAHFAARLNALGARSFNEGMRGYYFALASLVWFVHPYAFIGATLAVIAILYRREFHSKTLKTLRASLQAAEQNSG
ncbi:hypothetical protein CAI21_18510 [Alkalilimnicola ehrlichii]|uniref:DUF599 domain-containing protein n=1 Tax=Alkalilimnicola ehrlichii TaxID=351052 RepID=A0A3E0WL16_9GAMM|nr:DUF599 domain-containing protein [Alkalilimnicola ehrlichii]RFA25758.1 hypothetical protein CAI21_18510 [Alkalilimnicola ehrlichii]RFA32841.1 hypothetical protein CAL65_18765 [Alkalilimnicola ehrlichii]